MIARASRKQTLQVRLQESKSRSLHLHAIDDVQFDTCGSPASWLAKARARRGLLRTPAGPSMGARAASIEVARPGLVFRLTPGAPTGTLQ